MGRYNLTSHNATKHNQTWYGCVNLTDRLNHRRQQGNVNHERKPTTVKRVPNAGTLTQPDFCGLYITRYESENQLQIPGPAVSALSRNGVGYIVSYVAG